MRRNFVSPLLVLLFLAALASVSFAQSGQEPKDPQDDDVDVPRIIKNRIDKSDYLRRRSRLIGLKRGLNDLPAFGRRNPRAEAIRQMQLRQRQGGLLKVTEEQFNALQMPALNMAVAGTWTAIGPAPIPNGQTSGTSTPVSGRVVSIAIHPTNPDILYVGTAQGGLYRSLDGGNSWTQLMDNAQSLAIGAVAIAPSNPSTVWVGTGEASFSCDSYFGVGLYRIDNADSGSPILNGPFNKDASNTDVFSNRSVGKILVHPTDPNVVFVGTASGIGGIGCDPGATLPTRGLYRTTNGTSANPTFSRLTIGNTAVNLSTIDLVFEPGNPNNMLVSVIGTSSQNGGIWRTTDAQAAAPTFTRTLALGSTSSGVRVAFAINKVGSVVTVYAATSENGTGICSILGQAGQLRKSTDGGQTWGAAISGANGFCGGQCTYDIAVSVDPNNANLVMIGGSAASTCSVIVKRATNGSTFSASQTGLHPDTHAIAVAPSNPSVVYTGNDGGVWRSNDSGASWTSLNKVGFNATQFQSIAVHPTDMNFSIGGTQDNGTNWYKPDGTWVRADYGDGGFALIDQNATDTTNVTMYHTYFNIAGSGGLIGFGRVTNTANAQDDGWTFLGCGSGTANGINCNDSAVQFYAPMALGPGNPNTLYFGTDRLYRSTNQGTNMTVVSQQFVSGVATSAIGISPQNDNVRIVGLENGKVFATTTGSSTLTDVTGAIPAKYVARAVIDPNNVNTAYVTLAGFGLAAGQHVWKTTNLNSATPTWTAAGNGIPDIPVNAFVVDPNDSNNLFAGSDIGVFNSTDGGATWASYGSGLPIVAVFDMAIQNPSRTLRIATHGRGMWEILLSSAPPAPPAAPSALSATAASSSQINLAWTDNSNNESNFRIERCQGAGCTNFAQIATVGANVTVFNDTGLTASTSYSYRVRASNAGGDSGYSNTASATTQAGATIPNAPSGLSAAATSSSQINLSWADNSNNEDSFRIERCQGAGCTNFAEIASVGANVTTFNDTGLAASTTYIYRVRARNSAGDSDYSNTASATTQAAASVPAAPSNLRITLIAPRRLDIAWNDNSTNETRFEVERRTASTSFANIANPAANTTTFANTGLTRRTTYTYRVRACNANGCSAYSNEVSGTTN
jgi:hypothetical protein